MKILKRAEQRNFEVDYCHYTEKELEQMHKAGKVFTIDEVFNNGKNYDDTYRIDAEEVKELKIVCDEDGFYRNVAILKTGEKIYIEL